MNEPTEPMASDVEPGDEDNPEQRAQLGRILGELFPEEDTAEENQLARDTIPGQRYIALNIECSRRFQSAGSLESRTVYTALLALVAADQRRLTSLEQVMEYWLDESKQADQVTLIANTSILEVGGVLIVTALAESTPAEAQTKVAFCQPETDQGWLTEELLKDAATRGAEIHAEPFTLGSITTRFDVSVAAYVQGVFKSDVLKKWPTEESGPRPESLPSPGDVLLLAALSAATRRSGFVITTRFLEQTMPDSVVSALGLALVGTFPATHESTLEIYQKIADQPISDDIVRQLSKRL